MSIQMVEERRFIRAPSVWTGNLPIEQWRRKVSPRASHAFQRLNDDCEAGTDAYDLAEQMVGNIAPLVDIASQVQEMITTGPGFCVLTGLPVTDHSKERIMPGLWAIGHLLGTPRYQNPRGDKIGVVAARPGAQFSVGVSTGDREAKPHTEKARPPQPPKIIALLSLQTAESGGESMVFSGHSVHNEILLTRPDCLNTLYCPFEWGRHDEPHDDGRIVDLDPIFAENAGRVRVRYGRDWHEVAAKTTGNALTDAQRQALDAFDRVLEQPGFGLKYMLEPGDLLVVDNESVLHARLAFRSSIERTRCLLRLWID